MRRVFKSLDARLERSDSSAEVCEIVDRIVETLEEQRNTYYDSNNITKAAFLMTNSVDIKRIYEHLEIKSINATLYSDKTEDKINDLRFRLNYFRQETATCLVGDGYYLIALPFVPVSSLLHIAKKKIVDLVMVE
ncbi:hypothetical protein GOV06_00940 [Candidatus Woesearchaeota archaeon]|nr:hypothetical protein [Candidatus Woesearchaeota archaeon]